ncbi:hypothetical protein PV08_10494 [Exophiala spinifera]|uniref:NmrA-like domain-containing protein n=1 Tax=Exophiala spinifera TaxID=91928 RepID=A0A0D2BIJ9_9EURO|nr:uncharacterized protein PV08_10494 [Exophiala spinifera]KIW11194.1 hypothetical protein PV08_10494 [Exophiala spinifera]
MSSIKKTIVVVGATGNQGGSVARTFLAQPQWHVRCLTRNPSSKASQTLRSLGAEVVQGDLSSRDSLRRAFEGANAIYANTDFWAIYTNPDTAGRSAAAGKTSSQFAFDSEVSHGTNVAEAAASIDTLERFIYSALAPVKKASNGKYLHSYHWDSKAAIVEYVETRHPLLAAKMSVIYLGAYANNPLLYPRWDEDSRKYGFTLPMSLDAKMPIIDAAESTGPFVMALVETEDAGKRLLAYDTDSYLHLHELVDLWTRIIGQPVSFTSVTVETMNQQSGIPLEVLDGPAFISEFGYMSGVEGDIIEPPHLKAKVKTKSFEDWVKSRDWKEILDQGKRALKTVEGK